MLWKARIFQPLPVSVITAVMVDRLTPASGPSGASSVASMIPQHASVCERRVVDDGVVNDRAAINGAEDRVVATRDGTLATVARSSDVHEVGILSKGLPESSAVAAVPRPLQVLEGACEDLIFVHV